mmetsp:Transcript_1158/g.3350  ORF Transcript_1158/g.3350 Transcript_1158/m.3350 type:complete len:100 (+) Transcript_1158:711-1010(+)
MARAMANREACRRRRSCRGADHRRQHSTVTSRCWASVDDGEDSSGRGRCRGESGRGCVRANGESVDAARQGASHTTPRHRIRGKHERRERKEGRRTSSF